MLNIKNNRLYFGDKLFVINEANSPESRLRDLYYPELDELNSYNVNTLYASCNAKETAYTLNPFINNTPSLGIDEGKTTNWLNYLTKWVFGYPGKLHIVHLLLSEKETHYNLTEAQHKQMMAHLVDKFDTLEGYIIWDREELDNNQAAYINTYYSYLKQISPVSIRAIHNNTGQNPWSSHYNSDLIQFLSFQENESSFGSRINSEVPKNSWAGYVSEKTQGFQSTDTSKVAPLINCSQYNSGIGFYIAGKDHSQPTFQSQYKNLYLEADRVINNTIPQPTNMTVGISLNSDRSDFKPIPSTFAPGAYYVEARQVTSPAVFTLKKDGVTVLTKTENVAPWDLNGGPAYTFTAGNYTLDVNDRTGALPTISFTVGTPPVEPPPTTKEPMEANFVFDTNKIELTVKINGVVKP